MKWSDIPETGLDTSAPVSDFDQYHKGKRGRVEEDEHGVLHITEGAVSDNPDLGQAERPEPTKEQLAQWLRDYPTWGHAAADFAAQLAQAQERLNRYELAIGMGADDVAQLREQLAERERVPEDRCGNTIHSNYVTDHRCRRERGHSGDCWFGRADTEKGKPGGGDNDG